ncbi:GGDEF domain-containing protein [Alteromonas pelagimontana]|uniref:diguanylate cyclase n=1 Tax=Alteromonas pelagimontana TaxID=1858656 RepID=A0A6M4MFY3_9ALTE|nr:GGDEF domain-containing protein [Alteromonas pelagimontana]QJR81788.1 GGDEF domain-containing protein [Alteromonas pelagimontana]
MDFSTPLYDSTVQENYFLSGSSDPIMSTQQMNTFMNQMLSTIDVATLGSVYYHQLRQHLPIVQLSLSDFDSRLMYGTAGQYSPISVELDLPMCRVSDNSHGKNVHYVFSSDPSRQQRKLLAELHLLFSQQLNHALEFERMKQMATKDSLTGLGNRNGFNEACERKMSRAMRYGHSFALLVIDLDNFKSINDSLGHQEGDSVLIAVSEEINQALRGADEAFRFGGDEFCCLLDCKTATQLSLVASRLQDSISQSAYLSKRRISCSIGGAIYREGDDISTLFDRADSALYKVKKTGKNDYRAA